MLLDLVLHPEENKFDLDDYSKPLLSQVITLWEALKGVDLFTELPHQLKLLET